MTLRILLQKLHHVAGELGADTPVHIQGLGRHKFIEAVKTDAGRRVVLQLADSPPKTASSQRRRYEALKRQGRCTRCTEKFEAGRKAIECASCAEIRRLKRSTHP